MLDKLMKLDYKISDTIDAFFKIIVVLFLFLYIFYEFSIKDKILTKEFLKTIKKPVKYAIALTVFQYFPLFLLIFNEVGIIAALSYILLSFVIWYIFSGIFWFGFGSDLFVSGKINKAFKKCYESAKNVMSKKPVQDTEEFSLNESQYVHDYDFTKIFEQ